MYQSSPGNPQIPRFSQPKSTGIIPPHQPPDPQILTINAPYINLFPSLPSTSFHSNTPHIIEHGIGKQQQSYPSQEMHFVLGASGFTMLEMVLEAAEPGPLRLTNDGAEDWHILSVVWVVAVMLDAGGVVWVVAVMLDAGGVVSGVQERGHRERKAQQGPVGSMNWETYLCVRLNSEKAI
jgi:hypothetical protein